MAKEKERQVKNEQTTIISCDDGVFLNITKTRLDIRICIDQRGLQIACFDTKLGGFWEPEGE